MCGNKDGQFFVLDVQTGRSFRTSPKNVAVERDFNRINVQGMAPDALENALAPFEREAVQALASVSKGRTYPERMDYHRILNLLCLFAVRNPMARKTFNQTREQVLHLLAEMHFSDKRYWKQHLRDAGYANEREAGVSFEEMRNFVKEGNYEIKFPTDSNLALEFEIFDKLLPILGQRHWTLMLTPASGPELICCDHPVMLTWKDRGQAPIGFALPRTEVFFPMTSQAGFYGIFEDPLEPVINLTPNQVASMNSMLVQQAERQVYCAKPEFAMLYDGQVREFACTGI